VEGRPPDNIMHRQAFCSYDLERDQMTFIYEFDIDILKVCLRTQK